MVLGYVRVSTEHQTERGVSLEAQTEKIEAMAILREMGSVEVIHEAGESGKSLRRPGIERLLFLVLAGAVTAVIVAKLDRLTRSVRDLGELLDIFQRKGVALISVAESLDTSSAAGRLVLNVMMSVSQWEREAIAERTRDALRYKKAGLRIYSPVPFGFQREGDALVAHETELVIVRGIFEEHRAGNSMERIARQLNARKVRTKRGKRWYASTISHLLRNDLYASHLAA